MSGHEARGTAPHHDDHRGRAAQRRRSTRTCWACGCVKKTVNFDQPEAYHLYFGDEQGAPGSILTWFEFAGAARGRAGVGQDPHASSSASPPRPRSTSGPSGCAATATRARDGDTPALRRLRRAARSSSSSPTTATRRCAPSTPRSRPSTRSSGIEGARAYSAVRRPSRSGLLTDDARVHLPTGDGEYRLDGEERHFHWAYDAAPAQRGRAGRGHRAPHRVGVARRGPPGLAGARRARPAATSPTCATATTSTRSTSASRAASCSRSPRCRPASPSTRTRSTSGEELRLPKQHEHLRAQLEQTLTPLVNPRAARAR